MAVFYRILLVALVFAVSVESQLHNETMTSPTPLVEFNVTDVESTTVRITTTIQTTAATSALSTSTTKIPTSAPISPKPERDVPQTQTVKVEALSSAPVNCSVALENWITSDWDALLEKISTNGSSEVVATTFCELKPSNFTCLNESKQSSDHSAPKKVESIEAIKKNLCSKEHKDLQTLTVNGHNCLLVATNVTKECVGSTKTYKSPAEYFLRANFSSAVECKNLTNANGCITSKLQSSPSCSADQQRVWGQVIRHLAPPSCAPEVSTSKNSGSSPLANGFLYSLPLVVLFKIGSIAV